ncbi:hypothetical protein TKK_0014517 [Trichogramma kaykai]
MWFGEVKPIPNLFLTPMVDEFEKFYQGVMINDNMVRAIIMSGTADSPARKLFLNVNQFNGKFGCFKCKLKGEKINKRWVYPYTKLDFRSDSETKLHAEQANDTKQIVFGVKGFSMLSLFVYKPILTTALDIMHLGNGGVAQQILNLLFNKEFSSEQFSLSSSVDLVDSQLTAIKPPSFVQKKFCSIKKHGSHWKSSESNNWLFYASPILLKDLMLDEYYQHHQLLVLSLYILSSSSISPSLLKSVQTMLNKYVRDFSKLYHPHNMSSNVHYLLHLPKDVEESGPLFTTSCFVLEDINGKRRPPPRRIAPVATPYGRPPVSLAPARRPPPRRITPVAWTSAASSSTSNASEVIDLSCSLTKPPLTPPPSRGLLGAPRNRSIPTIKADRCVHVNLKLLKELFGKDNE